jgi:trehalose 6-phosphate synthase
MAAASSSQQPQDGAPTDAVTAAQKKHIEDLCQSAPPMEGASLIVVSNRLPVTIKVDPSVPGGYTFTLSSGGLVSALSGCKKTMNFTWIGWPGLSVPPKDEEYIEKRLREEYSCQPVWLLQLHPLAALPLPSGRDEL